MKIKKIITCILIVIVIFTITGCKKNKTAENDSNEKIYKLGDNVPISLFDKKFENSSSFELKLDSKYSITNVDNKHSTYHKAKVIKIGVTLTNKSSDSEYVFAYTATNQNNQKLDTTVCVAFKDGINMGTLKANKSIKGSMYILYDKDGTYKLEVGGSTIQFDVKS